MLLLLRLRAVIRLNLPIVAGVGAATGALAGLLFKDLFLHSAAIGCVAGIIAYPAIARANTPRTK